MSADPLREALGRAGLEPDFNVCAACGHPGGEHDLSNWCLTCPRPETTFEARSNLGTAQARLKLGWCYFSSMTEDQKWDHGIAALRAALAAYDRAVSK